MIDQNLYRITHQVAYYADKELEATIAGKLREADACRKNRADLLLERARLLEFSANYGVSELMTLHTRHYNTKTH